MLSRRFITVADFTRAHASGATAWRQADWRIIHIGSSTCSRPHVHGGPVCDVAVGVVDGSVLAGECGDEGGATAMFILGAGGMPGVVVRGRAAVIDGDAQGVIGRLVELEDQGRGGMFDRVRNQFADQQQGGVLEVVVSPVGDGGMRDATCMCGGLGAVRQGQDEGRRGGLACRDGGVGVLRRGGGEGGCAGHDDHFRGIRWVRSSFHLHP